MKLIKALFLVLSLSLSASAFAINDDDYMPYTAALGEGNLKFVKSMIESEKAKVNEKFFGWSALQIAANKGQLEVVKYLLDKGAEINYQHPVSMNTAFHLAALSNHKNVLKYLVERGADVNIKLKADVSLIRPLKDEGNTEMVEYLKSLGVSEEGCQGQCF